jgi:stage II sporulation protein D
VAVFSTSWALPFLVALLSGVSAMASPIASAITLENPNVRVRMETKIKKLNFEAVGLQIRGREQMYELISIPHSEDVSIERVYVAAAQKMAWKIHRAGQEQLIFDRYLMMKNVSMRKGGHFYPSQVILSGSGKLKDAFDVIGVLPLENYLVGVVASEMPLSWPIEALKAQAVAARSYTLVSMRERAGQIFHVESNILDQVFTHISQHQEQSGLTAKAKAAVSATEGLVLLDSKRQVLKAYYHSDCGGKTSNASSIWGYGVSTGSAVDSWCPSNPKAHWSFEINQKSLSEKLQKFARHPMESVIALVALRPSPEDRVEKMKIQWASGNGGATEERTIMAAQFREALGFDQMRSTFFDMQKQGSDKDSEYLFIGQGFGHGVGLCQWGAKAQAKAGRSYMDILKHYYPRAETQLLKSKLARQFEGREAQN